MKLVKTAILAGAIATLMSGVAAAQEFTFKLHHFLGPKAPAQTQMLEPWAKAVEENSGGKVKIEIYPSMSLGGAPPELVAQARDGVVDLIWTVNGYTPGLFPRTEVFELPFIHTNDITATDLAMRDMFDEYLADDYKGLKVLFLHVHAGQAIQMASAEVRKPEDLAGKKMRIPTRTGAWVIEALGASPAAMPVPDLPQALSKGVVDGALIPWEIIPALSLQDQTKYQIEGADMTRFGNTTFQVSMNLDRWNGLPEDVQKAFTDASNEDWVKKVGEIWRNIDNNGIKVATDAGNTHIELTPEETDAFKAKLDPVVDRWVADVKGKGIDGDMLVKKARELIASHASK
ncbi:TRAP transporter substrate-binding protein [Rhizobium halophytocola]|uniref:TRAP-type C4-dicarboxylate transport system substrate-binding protein n=1 Tax=Rhizobium halophytocola TaxID=735519 RepID=A0ABS4DST9_9HYPH|nr:TRAP transporter substrate-binding protein [Rhizobium halophytocola]MBP1848757.1 TRAP-type C4-dicarboxylate transport system substrate-binding protein [Rhizobium halophytocola]